MSEDVPTSLSYYFYDAEYNRSALSGNVKFTKPYAQHIQREVTSLYVTPNPFTTINYNSHRAQVAGMCEKDLAYEAYILCVLRWNIISLPSLYALFSFFFAS